VTSPYPLDTLGLWDAAAGLPEQLDAAADEARAALRRSSLPAPGTLRTVAVLGMGSSGLAGDAAAASGTAVPVIVHKGYGIPAFVGPDTLVFAVSWSGDTEETCDAARSALAGGAPVVVVSSGGALTALAQESDLPFLPLPAGLPASRTAWGATVVALLVTLAHLGVLPDAAPSLAAAVSALRRRRDVLVAPGSPAEEVARRIGRTIPLIYGSAALGAVAAQRWKAQINANAKTPAFVAVQPELSHGEVAGWGQHGDVTRQVLSLITLRQAGERPGVARRVARVNDAVDEVMAEGDDDLGRMFDLALFGDFVSLHLAGREGVDPGPVPIVNDVQAAQHASHSPH
jgi:glucose/mannose-6-phosphate isomerase